MDDLLRDLDKADQDARKRRVDDQQETEARRALADAHDHLRYLKPQHVQEGWQEGERLPDAFWPKLADAIRKYVDGLSQTEHAKRLEELRDGGETDRRWAVAVYQLVQAGNIQDAEEHLRTRLSNDGDFDGNVYWRRRNWLVNRLPAELTGCQEEPESESETLDVAEQKLAAGGKVLTAANLRYWGVALDAERSRWVLYRSTRGGVWQSYGSVDVPGGKPYRLAEELMSHSGRIDLAKLKNVFGREYSGLSDMQLKGRLKHVVAKLRTAIKRQLACAGEFSDVANPIEWDRQSASWLSHVELGYVDVDDDGKRGFTPKSDT